MVYTKLEFINKDLIEKRNSNILDCDVILKVNCLSFKSNVKYKSNFLLSDKFEVHNIYIYINFSLYSCWKKNAFYNNFFNSLLYNVRFLICNISLSECNPVPLPVNINVHTSRA